MLSVSRLTYYHPKFSNVDPSFLQTPPSTSATNRRSRSATALGSSPGGRGPDGSYCVEDLRPGELGRLMKEHGKALQARRRVIWQVEPHRFQDGYFDDRPRA